MSSILWIEDEPAAVAGTRESLVLDGHEVVAAVSVAELFARDGFEVDLTSRTGDGGADIYAVRKTGLAEHRYAIECKRNAPDNRVGVALVRQLRGGGRPRARHLRRPGHHLDLHRRRSRGAADQPVPSPCAISSR